MWIESIAFFLGVAVLFYCLFAGADFGAGILEFFRGESQREEQQELMAHAISPVWEANHVWLILAIVILFNGFPRAYSVLSTRFHIPVTLTLVGVILRGCAFTFRQYDAVRDSSQKFYTWIFAFSSILTPLMLGTVAGAVFLGRIESFESGFISVYITSWFNLFSLSVGVFACVLFVFLAAVYLSGEAKNLVLRKIFIYRAQVANVAAVISGGLVFLCAQWTGLDLISIFSEDPISVSCMALASITLIPLWTCLRRERVLASRLLAGVQMALILIGWFKLQFPVIIASRVSSSEPAITLYSTAAPDGTLRYLLISLVVGSLVIFPALFLLLSIFKSNHGSKAKRRGAS